MFKKINKKALAIVAVIVAVLAVIFLTRGGDIYESQKMAMDSAGSEGGVYMTNSLAMAPSVDRKMDYNEEMLYDEMDGEVAGEMSTAVDRKLEKRVSLNLVIENKESFVNKVHELIDFYNGYEQNFYDNNYEYNPTISVDIKIPVDQLDHFLADLKGAADYIESESLTVNDVTLEYVDLKSRLENAQAEEQQYLEIMKKAYDIEDVLEVTRYLSQAREEIEAMQGQMNYLLSRTDYAVVSIYAKVLQEGQDVEDPWSLKQTWKEAVNDLMQNTKYFIEDGLYWLVTNSLAIAFWAIIALIAYIVYRKKFSPKRKK